jgi:hypothetical protein
MVSFYPAELREKFGAEMIEVFLEDLEDSRRRGGWIGASRVWWRSVRELCRIGLPAGISRREIAVPLIVYLFEVFYVGSVILLTRKDPHNAFPKSLGEDLVLVVFSGLIPAVIARIAQLVGDASAPDPLRLRS